MRRLARPKVLIIAAHAVGLAILLTVVALSGRRDGTSRDSGRAEAALPPGSDAQTAPGHAPTAGERGPDPDRAANAPSGPARGPRLPRFPEGIDLRRAKLHDGRYSQRLPDGTSVVFTLDPVLQAKAAKILARHPIPHAGVVALDPRTGRILVWAGRSSTGGDAWDLPADVSRPAASTFKVVTAAALLDSGHVREESRVCYHGGFRRLTKRNVVGDPRRDRKCIPFKDALAKSTNSVFAHLAYEHLSRDTLLEYAEGFGYNKPLEGFPLSVPVSPAELPAAEDRVELARAAAGFWHVFQSPLQGTLVAAAVANGGQRMLPLLVEEMRSGDGTVRYKAEPVPLNRALSEETARRVGRLMVRTTTVGTARRRYGRRGWRHRDVAVAGKTGSLTDRRAKVPIHCTWFVGFAPADEPEIAVGALVGNAPLWHIKATFLAREVLDAYLRNRDPKPKPKR